MLILLRMATDLEWYNLKSPEKIKNLMEIHTQSLSNFERFFSIEINGLELNFFWNTRSSWMSKHRYNYLDCWVFNTSASNNNIVILGAFLISFVFLKIS